MFHAPYRQHSTVPSSDSAIFNAHCALRIVEGFSTMWDNPPSRKPRTMNPDTGGVIAVVSAYCGSKEPWTFVEMSHWRFRKEIYIILRGALWIVRRTFITHYALRITHYAFLHCFTWNMALTKSLCLCVMFILQCSFSSCYNIHEIFAFVAQLDRAAVS